MGPSVKEEGQGKCRQKQAKKTKRKFDEELELGYVEYRDEKRMKIFRETKQGAIPTLVLFAF